MNTHSHFQLNPCAKTQIFTPFAIFIRCFLHSTIIYLVNMDKTKYTVISNFTFIFQKSIFPNYESRISPIRKTDWFINQRLQLNQTNQTSRWILKLQILLSQMKNTSAPQMKDMSLEKHLATFWQKSSQSLKRRQSTHCASHILAQKDAAIFQDKSSTWSLQPVLHKRLSQKRGMTLITAKM